MRISLSGVQECFFYQEKMFYPHYRVSDFLPQNNIKTKPFFRHQFSDGHPYLAHHNYMNTRLNPCILIISSWCLVYNVWKYELSQLKSKISSTFFTQVWQISGFFFLKAEYNDFTIWQIVKTHIRLVNSVDPDQTGKKCRPRSDSQIV